MDIRSNPKKYFWLKVFIHIGLLQPVLTLFFLSRGLNYVQIFSLFATIVIAMLLFEVPTGIVADKFGRKVSIICGIIGLIITSILLIFAHSYLLFLVVYFLSGVTYTFLSGSDEALIYDSLKQTRKQKQMKKVWAKIISAQFLPLIFATPFAAYIAKDLLESQFIILIIGHAVFSLFALIVAFTLVEPKIKSGTHETRSPKKLLLSAVKHIKKSPALVRLFMNKTLIIIPGFHIFFLLWQPYFQQSGIPVAYFGVVMSIGSLVLFILLRNMHIFKPTKNFLFYTALFPMLAFGIASVFTGIIAALVFYFTIRILVWIREPVFAQFMNDHIESHNRATVLSSLSMIDSFFDVIIFLSAGYITSISLSLSFAFSAGVMLIGLIFFRITDEHIKVKL
jgi:MFS family permease